MERYLIATTGGYMKPWGIYERQSRTLIASFKSYDSAREALARRIMRDMLPRKANG